MSEAPVKREKKPFKKQMYRGHERDKLLEMGREEIVSLMGSRQRRRFRHGFSSKYDRLVKKVRIAKRDSVPGEKPKSVRTHLRNAVITPEMCGGVVDVLRRKTLESSRSQGRPHSFAHSHTSRSAKRHAR